MKSIKWVVSFYVPRATVLLLLVLPRVREVALPTIDGCFGRLQPDADHPHKDTKRAGLLGLFSHLDLH